MSVTGVSYRAGNDEVTVQPKADVVKAEEAEPNSNNNPVSRLWHVLSQSVYRDLGFIILDRDRAMHVAIVDHMSVRIQGVF